MQTIPPTLMNVIPIDDKVVVEPVEPAKFSPGGIYLPQRMQVAKEHKVLAVGNGKTIQGGPRHGERVPLDVKEGDTVILQGPSEIIGQKFTEDDFDKRVIVNQSQILAIVSTSVN